MSLDSNKLIGQLINRLIQKVIHYKEYENVGRYGLRRQNIKNEIPHIEKSPEAFKALIEEIIQPNQVEAAPPYILTGDSLRYMIQRRNRESEYSYQPDIQCPKQKNFQTIKKREFNGIQLDIRNTPKYLSFIPRYASSHSK